MRTLSLGLWGGMLAVCQAPVWADLETHGLLDLRLQHADSDVSWLQGGEDKQRFDRHDGALQLGQAVLEARYRGDAIDGRLWLNAYGDRLRRAGLGEAYVRWRPPARSAWRWQARAGLYFPELSLENSGMGWTSDYLISSSAINTWVGEELRALGGELSLRYQGAQDGSAQDWRFTVGGFDHNDPAGGLMAWRGWSVGDRVTAVDERLRYPALPVFSANGYWAGQSPDMEPFRELDHRAGYYAGAAWSWLDRFSISLMHYDNQGDPRAFDAGQWAWRTEFNHLGLRWHDGCETVLAQVMSGRTLMGYIPMHDLAADFGAWYVLASHQAGKHRLTVRYDRFWVLDRDGHAADPNGEYGSALAAGWNWAFRPGMDTGIEWLRQDSDRDARALTGLPEERRETLWQGRVRWWF